MRTSRKRRDRASKRRSKSYLTRNRLQQVPREISTLMYRGTAVVALGGFLLASGCDLNNANPAAVNAPNLAAADQIQSMQQQDLTMSGHAEPFQQVPIFAPSAGKITKMLVQLGAYVEKGQKLAEVDGGDLATRIKQAQAQVKQNQVEARMKLTEQRMNAFTKTGDSSSVDIETAKLKVKDLQFALSQAQQKWNMVKNSQQQPQELTQAQKSKDQLEQQLNAAKQALDAAQAKVDKLYSGQNQAKPIDPALQAELDTAKANLSQLQFAYANAQVSYDQLKNQLDQKASYDSQLAQAAAAKDQADYDLNAAQQVVNMLSNKANGNKQTAQETSKLQQQLDQDSETLAEISVEQAQANLESLQYVANNLQLVAPISGFITEPMASGGTDGGSSTKESPLFMISNLDQVYVKIDAQEAIIGKISLKQQATVTFPAIGKTFKGQVFYIGEVADLNTMTYPVRILIDNKDHLIRGGMRAQVTLN